MVLFQYLSRKSNKTRNPLRKHEPIRRAEWFSACASLNNESVEKNEFNNLENESVEKDGQDGQDTCEEADKDQFINLETVNGKCLISVVVDNTESYNNIINNSTWDRVHEVLSFKGMKDHFQSMLGGTMKEDSTKILIRRIAALLTWTYQQKCKSCIQDTEVIQWFHTLIRKEYILVQSFSSKYLIDYRQLSPATCRSYVNDFSKAVNWFLWFRESRDFECPIEGASAGGIIALCSKLKSSFKPSIQKQRLKKTLEHLVESGSFPSRGLVELQEVMVSDIKWAKNVDEHVVRNCTQTYNRFMAILISAMYCESPQGRIGGNLNCLLR